jgi:hypothetical protein
MNAPTSGRLCCVTDIGRRRAIAVIGAASDGAMLAGTDVSAMQPTRKPSMITCVIRYQIDPFQRERSPTTRGTGDTSSLTAADT